ncbi:MAG TPA: TonB family protein [Opitutaceae bacterium]|nr:TonB family protein [Opitutaceae bacterium]
MPKAEEIQVIIELTHHALHALRAVSGKIEAGGECVPENRPALEALLGAVAPSGSVEGVRADSVWPDGVDWHLSTDTEALLDRTGESLRAIAGATQGESKFPFAYAACSAGDGGPINPDGMDKWILAFTARESLERLSGGAPGVRVEAGGAGSAAFAQIGAISGALRRAGKGSVALWDLGMDASHLLLVTANGVEGAAPCSVGLNEVFEAVRAALKLKFRGAGARLFFNEGYDFSEPGPRICSAVGASLKQALGLLPHPEDPPALACIGLTGKQAWFIRDIAAAAGASPWAPDLKKLAGDLGLEFANDAAEASFSAASAGIFELLSARLASREAWNPPWIEAEAPAAEVVEPQAPVEAPEPAAQPVPLHAKPKPSLASEGGPAPPPVAQRPPRPAAPADPLRQPAPAVFASAAFAPPPEPAATAPGASDLPPPLPPRAESARWQAAPAGSPLAKPAVTALPFEAGKIGPAVPAEAAPVAREEAQPKSKVGFYVGVVAAAALVFAAIAIVLDHRMEKIKEYDLEQQEALAHHLAEVRVRGTDQSRKEQPEQTPREAETAISATQAVATARPTAPPMPEVAMPSRRPGTLVVATEPAGASVSIDGAAPLTSPVKAEGVAPGKHRVRIDLAGHESVELAAEIRSSKTTDLGRVKLESALGTLELTSNPDGLDFAVRAATEPAGTPVRTGRTPATLADVPRGDYVVTFSRPGCHEHVERVSVARGATTPINTRYLDGALELASDPTGAWVDKDGTRLGSTPLVLHDLSPKLASFELTLPGYDPTPISCEIQEGQTLKITAKLLRRDRVFEASEVKTPPQSYESPEPDLSPSQRKMGAEVLLSFVVQRDGSVIDVKVEKATDDDIGRRCAAALSKWKFRPGTASDDRTVDVRTEMPFKFPAANP